MGLKWTTEVAVVSASVYSCVCVCVCVSIQMTCWSNCGTGTRSGPAPRCLRDTHTTSCRSSSTPRTTTSLPLHPWTEASRWVVSEEWWQSMIWRPQKKAWNLLCWFSWPCLSLRWNTLYDTISWRRGGGGGGTYWLVLFLCLDLFFLNYCQLGIKEEKKWEKVRELSIIDLFFDLTDKKLERGGGGHTVATVV